MTEQLLLENVRNAARHYQESEHQLRLSVTAARSAGLATAAIAQAGGVTRQTVYNWCESYGRGYGLTVTPRTELEALPVQRPRALKKEPVLVLQVRRRGRLHWDGRRGTATGYAGDMLGVSVPDRIVDVFAWSWALAGDSSGVGRRPHAADRVVCEDGILATVEDASGDYGDIQVVADGELRAEKWWAIILPGLARE
jgi:hypothetical protein